MDAKLLFKGLKASKKNAEAIITIEDNGVFAERALSLENAREAARRALIAGYFATIETGDPKAIFIAKPAPKSVHKFMGIPVLTAQMPSAGGKYPRVENPFKVVANA